MRPELLGVSYAIPWPMQEVTATGSLRWVPLRYYQSSSFGYLLHWCDTSASARLRLYAPSDEKQRSQTPTNTLTSYVFVLNISRGGFVWCVFVFLVLSTPTIHYFVVIVGFWGVCLRIFQLSKVTVAAVNWYGCRVRRWNYKARRFMCTQWNSFIFHKEVFLCVFARVDMPWVKWSGLHCQKQYYNGFIYIVVGRDDKVSHPSENSFTTDHIPYLMSADRGQASSCWHYYLTTAASSNAVQWPHPDVRQYQQQKFSLKQPWIPLVWRTFSNAA